MRRHHRSTPLLGCNGRGGAGRDGPEEHITNMQPVREHRSQDADSRPLVPVLGFETHRYVNAAQNILLGARAGRARSHACGDPASTPATKVGASGIVETGTTRGEPFWAIDAGNQRILSVGGCHMDYGWRLRAGATKEPLSAFPRSGMVHAREDVPALV